MTSKGKSSSSLDQSMLRVLRDKSKGTVAVFEKGDFYGVYDEDAQLVAREIFRSEVGMKRISMEGVTVSYMSLGGGQYERVIRDLLILLRYRVQLYTTRDGIWKMKCQGSAGNMDEFEEIGELGKEATPVVAVYLPPTRKIKGVASIAFCDTNSLRLSHAEVEDDEKLSHLEQCLLSSNARECLLLGDLPVDRLRIFKSLLRRSNILLTPKAKPGASSRSELLRLLSPSEHDKVSSLTESLGWCLSAAADFSCGGQSGWGGRFYLAEYGSGRSLHLDTAAIKAFELFSLSYHHGGGTHGTLFSTLNRCKTACGGRLLREWLSRPLCDLRQIEERQDVVEALVQSTQHNRILHSLCLPKLPDLAYLSRRLLRNKARLIDCYRVAQAMAVLRRMEKCVRELMQAVPSCAPAVRELMLVPVCVGLVQFENLEVCVEQTIDSEYFKKCGMMRVRPEIDQQLLRISEEMDAVERRCLKALQRISSRLHTITIKLDSNNQHGYFYKVTMKDEKALRGVEGVRLLDAGKGAGVRFRDSTLEALNEEYAELATLYEDAQKHLEVSTVAVCASYAADLARLSSSLATVDVLVSLATVSQESTRPWIRPHLLPAEEGVLELKAARHPVLDPLIHFIPNDVDMTETHSLIVTGANMGGKSTYLRATALCVLLAQIGSRLPAESARISLLHSIHARVGASDRQSKGLSTFMAEMLECAKILQNASETSLVVIDEIGRGTSTFDGFGLAWGITNDLIERVRCKTLVATHFTELAAIANPPAVRAVQMKVHTDGDELALLYQAEGGVADASLGIHVAKLVGIAPSVIERARLEMGRLLAEEEKREKERAAILTASDKELRSAIFAASF